MGRNALCHWSWLHWLSAYCEHLIAEVDSTPVSDPHVDTIARAVAGLRVARLVCHASTQADDLAAAFAARSSSVRSPHARGASSQNDSAHGAAAGPADIARSQHDTGHSTNRSSRMCVEEVTELKIAHLVVMEGVHLCPPETLERLYGILHQSKVPLEGHKHSVPPVFTFVAVVTRDSRLPLALRDLFGRSVFVPGLDAELQASQPMALASRDILSMRNAMRAVLCSRDVRTYIRDAVVALRNHPDAVAGPSPRAYPSIEAGARAEAFLSESRFATPSHVLGVVVSCLCHRVQLARRRLDRPDEESSAAVTESAVDESNEGPADASAAESAASGVDAGGGGGVGVAAAAAGAAAKSASSSLFAQERELVLQVLSSIEPPL
eukprot:m51a1_g9577 hypothetical protein (380) ;mRNA; r:975349-977259